MDDFECEVRGKVSEALAAMGAGDVQFPVEPSSVETVDLAVPCFTMSKAMRKSPQAIADELAAAIQPSGLISAVTSTNGYLNFNIDPTDMVFPMVPPGAPVSHLMLNPDTVFEP